MVVADKTMHFPLARDQVAVMARIAHGACCLIQH